MTIEVTWKYLGLLEVSNLWGHVFMQSIILLFLDMSEFKNKNRITFQNLKFIEAGQKKCHPEPCFFLALSKKLVNPHGSHFFFPFAVQMVATEKDVCYDVESLFWSFGNWIWHSTHDHLSQRGIVCVRCDVFELRKNTNVMTFCGGFLLEIFAKCKQIIEEYIYKLDSPSTTNRRATWKS